MNKHFLTCLTLAFALTALSGCKKDPEYGEPMTFKVMGIRGVNDFPENMPFGLFADSPVNADNVPFYVKDNFQTVLDNISLRWGFGQSVPSRLLVYAPYNPDYDGFDESEYNLPLDQSSIDGFVNANFMIGVASGKPGKSAPAIRLEHAMTAMMLGFDNRTGDPIDSCFISGFMTHGTFNKVTGTLTATDKNAVITPFKSPFGDDVFCFQYIPQEGTPMVYVQFKSGKTINLTFSSAFGNYPGKVQNPGIITLTEDMGPYNIIRLDGVSVTDWKYNVFPPFMGMYPYYNLRTLFNVEPDATNNGLFYADITKVCVTAIDSNATNVPGVILEDSTRAIYAWLYPGRTVKVGESYVGEIGGLMEKTEDDYHIRALLLDYATVATEKELPCTTGYFYDLVQDGLGNKEYRRMLFKDVKVVQQFSDGTAVFEQYGNRLPVCANRLTVIPSIGSMGNIIGFPVLVGGKPAIRLFDTSQLGNFKKEYESDAFTRAGRPGMYNLSDTAVIDREYSETSQITVRKNVNDRSLQISDLKQGEYRFYYIYSSEKSLTAGHEYAVAVHEWDSSRDAGTTVNMECVKVEDGKAWLKDRNSQKGLIIGL